MQLGAYSENGKLISPDDTVFADTYLRFNDAVDITQRKIFVTGKKTAVKIPVVLRVPSIAASQLDDDVFILGEDSAALIYLPKNAKNFSFNVDTDLDAEVSIEVYRSGPLSYGYSYGVLYEHNGETGSYPQILDRSFKFSPDFSPALISGFLDGLKDSDYCYALKIYTNSLYLAVISDFVAYSSFCSRKEKIPQKGFVNAILPDDVIDIIRVEKSSGGTLSEVRGGNLDFQFERNLLRAPISDEGLYYITYTKYPRRIDLKAGDDQPIELDGMAADALVFGTAALLCPEDNTALFAKLNALFEESMRNLYNVNGDITGVVNKVYSSNRKIGR